MKKILPIVFGLIILTGCGNLSPRQKQPIDNQNGKIEELENLANSMKIELGNLKSQNEIQNSKIGQMQQGMVNLQNGNENNGVQILSGSGGLLFSLIALISIIIAFYYKKEAKTQAKTSEILAQTIANYNDPQLKDDVFKAAMYTEVEENILNLIKKSTS